MFKKFIFRIWNLFRVSVFEFRLFIFDLIFPKFCVGCGLEGTWLCKECEKDILPVLMQTCPDCGKIRNYGRYCSACRAKQEIYLNGIITAGYYEEGPLREIIHNFKYNSVTELQDILVQILFEAYQRCEVPIDIITFTPIHILRKSKRGYNQAELLAQGLSKILKIECSTLLIKTKKTKRQVELTGKKRRENLVGAFRIRSKYQEASIKNKKILIIDDITTTGATLNECAKVLKEKGAKEVWGLVVARG